VTTAVASLYLNVSVLIVKSFQKISVLKHLASTQSDPPFLVAQARSLCSPSSYLALSRPPGFILRDYRQLTAIRPGPSDWLITDVALARRLPAYRRKRGPLWQAVRAFCTCRG
jgi:hypothetical protein